MSKSIDQKVVEMRFDNANFEKNARTSMSTLDKLKQSLKFEDSAKGFENLSRAAGKVDMGGLSSGVDAVKMKFSALEVMAVTALSNITNKAVDTGMQLVKSLSVDQMIDGWTKYEDKTSAVQTIMSATGLSIDEVNTQLAKLNWFTDETSYNFTDMTDNIGKFTSQGVDLETATVAMEGIATWAAKSGQGANSASRAMYNLSQALGVGAVKLQDWMSIENANMATAEFKQLAIDTAKELGTLSETADVTVTNFRENLSDGWFTSDVLIKVLNQYGGFADELYKISEQTGLSATELLSHLEEFQSGTLDVSSVAQEAALSAEELTEIFSRLGDETMSLGNTSFRAAQEAKTFTDMLNATKDAVSTGWMNTYELIFGNYEEAKKLWTDLANSMYEVFAGGAETRNELLAEWKELGGRDMLLESFWNSWNAFFGDGEEIVGVIGTIKEAFSDIFPPMTAERLVQITEKVRDLTEKFKMSEETSNNLKNTFKGLFAILDIGKQALSAITTALKPVANTLFDTGSGVLGLTGNLGEWLVQLDDAIRKNNTFGHAIETIAKTVDKAKTKLISFADDLKVRFNIPTLDEVIAKVKAFRTVLSEKISAVSVDMVSEAFERVKNAAIKVKDVVSAAVSNIAQAISDVKIVEFLEAIWNALTRIASGLAGGIGEGITAFFDAFGELDLSRPIDLLNSVTFAGIVVAIKSLVSTIKKSFTTLSDATHPFRDILDNVTGVLDSVKDSLQAWQHDLQASTLIKIASAILMLAISLTVIASIDGEKLSGALTGMTAMMVELVGAMAVLNKTNGVKSSGSLTSMIGLAASVAILVGSLKSISTLDPDALSRGLGGITALIAELVVAVKILSSNQKSSLKGMSQLILIATSMKIFVSVCEDFSTFKWSEIAKGLVGIGGLLLEFSGFQALMKVINPKKMLTSAISLVLIGSAMEIFADVCFKFGKLEWIDLGKSGAAITGILALASGFALLSGMSSKMTRSAIALTVIGAALEIFTDVCSKFGSMDWEGLGKAGSAITGILALVSGFALLSGMSKKMFSSSVALTVIGAALEIFADVCSKFGTMDWDGLAKSGVAIAGILALTSGFALLSGMASSIITSSAALLVMASALRVMCPVLLSLGEMSLAEIGKSLLVLAGAFTVIGVAGAVLGPIIPSILGLAAAFTLIGIGSAGLGAGLLAIASAFTALSAAGVAGATAFVSSLSIIVLGVVNMIPDILAQFDAIITSLCDLIINGAPAIAEAFKAIVISTIDVLVTCIPEISDGMLQMLLGVADALVTYLPDIVDSVFDLLIGILNGISSRLPELITAAVGVVMSLLQGIIDSLNGLDSKTLVNGILAVGMMTAFMASLSAMSAMAAFAMVGVLAMGAVVTELGLVLAAIGALSKIPGLNDLIESGGGFLQNVGTAIGKFVGGIVDGFAEGVSSQFPQIGTDLSNFMTNIQPFLEGASKIDSSVLSGVDALVDTIISLTKAELLSSLTSWLTGGTVLSDFGEELAEFGPLFADFSSSVSGVDVNAVDAAGRALKSIAEAASSIPNEGGLISKIVGDNTLAQFAEGLKPFGEALMDYGKSVAGIESYADDIEHSKTAAEALIALADIIPNSGGLLGLIVGNNDLADFAKGLKPFGEALMDYGKSVVGMSTYTDEIKGSVDAAEELIKLADIIPNSGGWLGKIVGNNDLADFAEGLKPFGEALMDYGNAVNGISGLKKEIKSSVDAAESVIDLANSIQNASSGKDLSTFGSYLTTFAQHIKEFVNECATLNSGQLDSLKEALQSITDIARDFAQIDTTAIDSFVDSMKTIGETSVADFLSSFTDSKTEASSAVATLMQHLTDAIKSKHSDLKRAFTSAAEAGLKGITSKKSSFQSAGGDLMKAVTNGASGQTSALQTKFTSMLTSCVTAVRNFYSQFQSAGSYLVSGLANGITANTSTATAAASKVASKAAASLNQTLKIKSPSRLTFKSGNYFGVGFVNGILNNVKRAETSGAELGDSAESSLSNAVRKIKELIDSDIDTTPTIRPVIDLTEIQNGAAALNDLINSLSGGSVNSTVSIAGKTANAMDRSTSEAHASTTKATETPSNETVTNTFYITGSDPKAIADEVDRKLQRRIERRNAAWA